MWKNKQKHQLLWKIVILDLDNDSDGKQVTRNDMEGNDYEKDQCADPLL